MNEIARIILLVQKTSGYNDKLAILQKYADTPGLKEVLKFIYNPYCKTGISNAKLAKASEKSFLYKLPNNGQITDYKLIIDYFTRCKTGRDSDLAVALSFINYYLEEKYDFNTASIAKAIITQDLSIGITVTSLNTVYGKSFIPKIDCMLGTLFEDVKNPQWPCIVTEKLDGTRRLLIKENGVCRMYSRHGLEDTGLVDILEEAKLLPNNTVYDGELLAAGTFKDSIEQRQATASIANSKGNRTGLIFNIFDMLPVDEFWDGKSTRDAKTRKALLAATFADTSLKIIEPDRYMDLIQAFSLYKDLKVICSVPILGFVNSINEVTPIVEELWAQHKEGVMLNSAISLYELKRSKTLMKVKFRKELVLPIVDFMEGTGKFEDTLGAVVVLYKGMRVGVGSGFTDAQRALIWANQSKFVGKNIEVETFGESTNALGGVSLNCPIFKRVVGDTE